MSETALPPKFHWTPPGWMNGFMKFMLRSPLHWPISKSVLLITFTGRKSGKEYTTPVSYVRDGDTVTVVTKSFRTWWKNLETHPQVTLRLGGKRLTGQANVATSPDKVAPLLAAFLAKVPRDARYYGITMGPDGQPDQEQVVALAPHIVVVQITLGGAAR